MGFGRKAKKTPLQIKQDELQEVQRLKLLEEVHAERMSRAPEYAKAYVAQELAKVTEGSVIPTIAGMKTPAELEVDKHRGKSRFSGIGSKVMGAGQYFQVPKFSNSMSFGVPASQQGSFPQRQQLSGVLCTYCQHPMNYHNSKRGTCNPPGQKPHYCGEVKN